MDLLLTWDQEAFVSFSIQEGSPVSFSQILPVPLHYHWHFADGFHFPITLHSRGNFHASCMVHLIFLAVEHAPPSFPHSIKIVQA